VLETKVPGNDSPYLVATLGNVLHMIKVACVSAIYQNKRNADSMPRSATRDSGDDFVNENRVR
jgi:hypothetical protein